MYNMKYNIYIYIIYIIYIYIYIYYKIYNLYYVYIYKQFHSSLLQGTDLDLRYPYIRDCHMEEIQNRSKCL